MSSAPTLYDCLHIDRITAGWYDQRLPWLRKHEHTIGPWCWVLTDVRRFDPVPWKGAQGLWECAGFAVPSNEPQLSGTPEGDR